MQHLIFVAVANKQIDGIVDEVLSEHGKKKNNMVLLVAVFVRR